MSKKLGISLGAGGARGIAHVGFLHALEQAGIQADFVTGCSMGAIVGACYCAGVPMETVRDTALSLKLSRIAAFNVNPVRSSGLCRLTRAQKLMEEILGGDRDFSQLKIPFSCVATDLISGRTVVLDKGSVVQAALASGSVPGIFSPMEMNGMALVDGGVLERVPVKGLKKTGAEVIVAVDVLGDLVSSSQTAPTNLISTFLRYIDVIDTRVTRGMRRQRRKSIDLWLEPELGTMDQYKVKQLDFAYEKGYELGKANLHKIGELIQ